MDSFEGLKLWLTPAHLTILMHVALLLFVGIPLIFMLSKWVRNYLSGHLTPQRGMIVGKAIHYLGLVFIFIMVLQEFGFSLGPLLGAAGIVGIAVGFASQTSVSNIISGIFLITEQPFVVNDVIKIGAITGQVLSIDTLSVKLRTFDNQFVRIPNETILKSEVTTLTRFPIRRADLLISVAYKEDLGRVKQVLQELADQNPLCLQEPAPLIIFEQFGSSSIDIKFAVWATRDDWLNMKNSMFESIKKRFDAEGIEIPFPHVTLYTGSVTKPFPVTAIGKAEETGEQRD